METIKVGISACLLGRPVRYDGGHKWDRYLTDTLGRHMAWVPVCPEVEYGLPVPREAMRLVGDAAAPRLMTIKTGIDHTEGMQAWAARRLDALAKEDLCGFIFKSRSPSSGMAGVKVYGGTGAPSRKGVGLFARAFMDRFPLLPVEDEGRLHDPVLRENFIERLFVYRRWQRLIQEGLTPGKLVAFHQAHKLLILSHSAKHLTLLGRIVAQADEAAGSAQGQYITLLMEALRLTATPKKHANCLMHMLGYFKKRLEPDEKQEVLELIDRYRIGQIPLVAPLVLLSHYVRKFAEPYLAGQVYLHPHPQELMLRNHV